MNSEFSQYSLPFSRRFYINIYSNTTVTINEICKTPYSTTNIQHSSLPFEVIFANISTNYDTRLLILGLSSTTDSFYFDDLIHIWK
jgi:hypothetical protein